ncbi:MAG: acetylxylan esterase [Spirochaetia bacterium]|nr:acetylxylan esterase [Spirochaetia bacterium]
MKTTFDDCFQTFPALRPPSDLAEFWKEALNELKKIPVDPKQKMLLKRSLGRESAAEVSFRSVGNARVRGLLSVPRLSGRASVVISFHEYGEKFDTDRRFTEKGIAHLAVELRDHERLLLTPAPKNSAQGQVAVRPSLFGERGLDKATMSYAYISYLDAARAVDFVRLQKGLEGSRIGLLGRGFGAAMAVFAASHKKENIAAVALERISFLYMTQWLKEARSVYAAEVRAMVDDAPKGRTKSRKALDYFDSLNWSEELRQPVLATVVLDDEQNPPKCSFAFFNHLKTEKWMELFTDTASDPDGSAQRGKSIRFLTEMLQFAEKHAQ